MLMARSLVVSLEGLASDSKGAEVKRRKGSR